MPFVWLAIGLLRGTVSSARFRGRTEGSTLGIVHSVSRDREITVDLAGTGFTQLLEVVGRGTAALDGTILTIAAQTSVILGTGAQE